MRKSVIFLVTLSAFVLALTAAPNSRPLLGGILTSETAVRRIAQLAYLTAQAGSIVVLIGLSVQRSGSPTLQAHHQIGSRRTA